MRDSTSNSKVSVIGAGSVGATLAYASLIRGVAHTVAIYDINADKTEAEVLDLRHGLQFVPRAEVIGSNDINVCAGSDIIAITAGAKQKPGQTRLELAETNINIVKAMMPKLLEVAPDAVFVLLTNPVDVVTYATQKFSGLPVHRVLGTGTVLDSSRLRELISRHTGVAVQSVHAWIAGEHGDSEFPLWSSATVGAVPLHDFALPGRQPMDEATEDRIAHEVVTAAERIIRGKGATNYAIGLAGARVLEAVIRDENSVLPVTSLLEGQGGVSDVCLSLPSVVSRRGVEYVLDTPMNDRELDLMAKSADEVKKVMKSVGL